MRLQGGKEKLNKIFPPEKREQETEKQIILRARDTQ